MHFWPRYPQAGSATGGFPDIQSMFTTNVISYETNSSYRIYVMSRAKEKKIAKKQFTGF